MHFLATNKEAYSISLLYFTTLHNNKHNVLDSKALWGLRLVQIPVTSVDKIRSALDKASVSHKHHH